MPKRWRQKSGVKEKKKPSKKSRKVDKPLLELTAESARELQMRQLDSGMKDLADVSEEKDSIISIVKSLEAQVDEALELKEALEAELDATQKKLSEESAARAQLEERVRSLEPQAARVDRLLRDDPSFAEEERDYVADLPQPPTRKGKSLSTREEIRSVVIEELSRLQTAGGKAGGKVALPKLEKRVQFMAETIEAIQNKISELSARGLPRETLVSAAIDSVEDVEFLGDEERAVLASIFRQNLAVQKPHLIDTAVS